MDINKLINKNNIEKILYALIIIFILANAFINKDSYIAVISAICGISYTIFAGKGKPFCYLFGVTGSAFYCMLALQSALWGNLILYACYYLPMQILGFFRWNKHLKEGKNEIVKIKLPKKEMLILLILLAVLTVGVYYILQHFDDKNPVLDSITTVFSIGGMYLTVRRAIEQWIFWFGVNILSLIMWINIALSGAKVYSTVIMWAVYTILAIYFYIEWKKELDNKLC